MHDLERFPLEIKEKIAVYLSTNDLYMLASVLPDYLSVFRNIRHLDFSFDDRVDKLICREVFNVADLTKIVTLNFNGIYWIKAADLRSFINRLPNLHTLLLAGTKISSEDHNRNFFKTLPKVMVSSKDPEVKNAQSIYLMNEEKVTRIKIINPKHDPRFDKPGQFHPGMNTLSQNPTLLNDTAYVFSLGKYLDVSKKVLFISSDDLKEKSCCEESWAFLLEKYPKVKAINIKLTNKRNINFDGFLLESVTNFKCLQCLSVETAPGMSPSFIITIFKECEHLKRIKVLNKLPQITLQGLKYAKKLEDISWSTTGSFQIDKFLEEVNSNQQLLLKRIYLKFVNFSKFSVSPMETLVTTNKRLYFFVMECDMLTLNLQKTIQKSFKSYNDSDKRLFLIHKTTPMSFAELQIPLMHYDMFFCNLLLLIFVRSHRYN